MHMVPAKRSPFAKIRMPHTHRTIPSSQSPSKISASSKMYRPCPCGTPFLTVPKANMRYTSLKNYRCTFISRTGWVPKNSVSFWTTPNSGTFVNDAVSDINALVQSATRKCATAMQYHITRAAHMRLPYRQTSGGVTICGIRWNSIGVLGWRSSKFW